MKILCLLSSLFLLTSILLSAKPQESIAGDVPKDSRFAKPTTLHDYHPFRKVDSKEAWAERKAHIIDRMVTGGMLGFITPMKSGLNS